MARISEIMLLHQPQQWALVIESKTDMNGLGDTIGKSFAQISAYLDELGEITADVPFVTYPDYENMDEKNISLIVGLKTSKKLPTKGNIKSVANATCKLVMAMHRGTYAELAVLYNEMSEWIKSNGYKASGTSIEYYYTGPDAAESEHVTRVEMPLV